MRKNRFAKLLLTGKVATLPVLIGQVRADVTPTYSDMIGSDLRVIEVPSGSAIRLMSIAADAGSQYAGTPTAYLCTNEALPANITVVVTGVNTGENVILAGAKNKNDPLHLSADKRMTIGSQNLTILGSSQLAQGLIPGPTGGTVGGTVAITVPTTTLTAIAPDANVFLQAVVIPAGATSTIASWKFSELDELAVGVCATSPYSTTSY